MVQEHKFDVGDEVYEVVRPQQKMIITRRNGATYYCRLIDDMKNAPLVFVERDLKK
jgi:uncharacterized protein YodC (DUF2158 family)